MNKLSTCLAVAVVACTGFLGRAQAPQLHSVSPIPVEMDVDMDMPDMDLAGMLRADITRFGIAVANGHIILEPEMLSELMSSLDSLDAEYRKELSVTNENDQWDLYESYAGEFTELVFNYVGSEQYYWEDYDDEEADIKYFSDSVGYPGTIKAQLTALIDSGKINIGEERLATVMTMLNVNEERWHAEMEQPADAIEVLAELVNGTNQSLTDNLTSEELDQLELMPDISTSLGGDDAFEWFSYDITGLLPELWEYIKTSVVPPLRDLRAVFDAQISRNDKFELGVIRSEAREILPLLEDAISVIDNTGDLMTLGADESMRHLKPELQRVAEFTLEHKELPERFGLIQHKYSKDVAALLASSDIDWKVMFDGAMDILSRYPMGFLNELQEDDGGKELMMMFAAEFFLLLEPAAGISGDETLSWVSAKPNPASTFMELAVRLKDDSEVQITILDKAGMPVKSVLSEPRAKGKNTILVDVSTLPNDFYYYHVKAGDKEAMVKFVVMN